VLIISCIAKISRPGGFAGCLTVAAPLCLTTTLHSPASVPVVKSATVLQLA